MFKKYLQQIILCLICFAVGFGLVWFLYPSENTLEKVTQQGDGKTFSCIYGGTEREFMLCSPINGTEGMPLVIMLHGYSSDGAAFKQMTGFDEPALQRGYAVAYVTGIADPKTPTASNGWNSDGDDEDWDDVGFLTKLAEYLQETYGFDKERTAVVGFSNGGFMTFRMATDASDTFAAAVSVSGRMSGVVWKDRPDTLGVSMLEIYGTKDDVVPQNENGSAKFSNAPAVEDVMEYFRTANGLGEFSAQELGPRTQLTKAGSDTTQVWTAVIADGHHSWPTADVEGFDANNLILDFLTTVFHK